MATLLPPDFASLESFADWALDSETKRNRKRIDSDFAEIVAFRDAMMAVIDKVATYLDQYKLDALPDDAKPLMYMLLSLAEVAPAIEFYGQPTVIDGFDSRRFVAQEHFALRPQF